MEKTDLLCLHGRTSACPGAPAVGRVRPILLNCPRFPFLPPGLLTTCSAALWGPRSPRAHPKASLLGPPGCSEQMTAAMGTTPGQGSFIYLQSWCTLIPMNFFKDEALDSKVQGEWGFLKIPLQVFSVKVLISQNRISPELLSLPKM